MFANAGFCKKAALACAAFLFLSACETTSRLPEGRDAVAKRMAPHGFVTLADIPVFTLLRQASVTTTLSVYIEGDGAAWYSPYHPPADPTPTKLLVLDMAMADRSTAVAYLARPCQFLDAMVLRDCSPKHWTSDRFSPALVEQMDQALDALKRASGASRLRLIGYSGGGVIATLLAARRQDVQQFVTVAAPLRLKAWVTHHAVTPLIGSDPESLTGTLPSAVHFVGGRDRVVPPEIVAPFAARTLGRLVVLPDYDHACCWSRDWPQLLKELK